jgi:hypothetical protein
MPVEPGWLQVSVESIMSGVSLPLQLNPNDPGVVHVTVSSCAQVVVLHV